MSETLAQRVMVQAHNDKPNKHYLKKLLIFNKFCIFAKI